MKLLVSGATGFIGSNLIKRLSNDGHTIHVLVRPASSPEKIDYAIPFTLTDSINDLIAYMEQEKFDGVVHLASLFLAQHKPEDIRNLIDSNVLFSTTLLEAAVKSNIPWFINTGTFWQHYENAPYSPVNLYAATKQAFEDIATYYLETSSINFVTLKLSDTFGPGDIRPKVMNVLAKIGKSGESLDMSPGEQLLDISFIDNVTDGFSKLIALVSQDGTSIRGKSFALKSGRVLSLKELVNVFEKTTGMKLTINWGKREYRLREVMVPWNTGETIPGWEPTVTLEEGIKRTFNA